MSEQNKIKLLEDELKLVTSINYKIQMNTDFNKIIHDIVLTLRKQLDFDGSNVALIDDEGFMQIHNVEYARMSPKYKGGETLWNQIINKKWELKTSDIWMCKSARKDKEFYFPDIKTAELRPDEKLLVNAFDFSSLYYLPIKLEGKILGTLSLVNYGDKPMHLTEFEKDVIRGRAVLIARLIDNTKLYTSLKQQKDEIENLNEITKNISSTPDLRTTFNKISEYLFDAFKFESCFFDRITDDNKNYCIEYCHYINKDLTYLEENVGLVLPLNERGGRISSCINNNELSFFPEVDLQNIKNKTSKQGASALNAKSIINIPVTAGDEKIGAFTLCSHSHNVTLTESDIEKIKRFVNQIAMLVKNAKLYDRINNQNKILEEYKKDISRDLLMAQNIQKNFLPQKIPDLKNCDIATEYIPMIEVGGDFYDFFECRCDKGDKLGVLITDASGHGVQAALITSMVKMAFNSNSVREVAHNPVAVLNGINEAVLGKTDNNFITALYAYFDFENMNVKIARAGHTPLIKVYNKEEKITEILPKGHFLGFLDDIGATQEDHKILTGERFVFYTDGLTEAINEDNIEYEDRFKSILQKSGDMNASELKDYVINDVKEFSKVNSHSLEDDVAIIVVDIK